MNELERLPALPENHWQHCERAYGVGPPPVEGGVKPDAREQSEREVGAYPGLDGVGLQCAASERSPGPLFRVAEGRVGFANSRGLVFMDESAEEIPTLEVMGRV